MQQSCINIKFQECRISILQGTSKIDLATKNGNGERRFMKQHGGKKKMDEEDNKSKKGRRQHHIGRTQQIQLV